jgi:hypothetical protein
MAKLNSEFNYRYQVIGETVWTKIKTLQGFMDGRKRAAALEKVNELKVKASYEKLKYLKEKNAPMHEILEHEANIVEMESALDEVKKNFEDNRAEIKILEKLFIELYELAEPTRLKHEDGTLYSDEEMFEVNEANEFTVLLAREMQAEIIATGRPSAAKIKNAMSNPITWSALKQIGIIDPDTKYIAGGIDPCVVQLLPVDFPKIAPSKEDLLISLNSNVDNEQASTSIQRKPVIFK